MTVKDPVPPPNDPIEAPAASEETVHSLARKLDEYAETLSRKERALLEHVLRMALPPHERSRLGPDVGLLSDADRDLLDRLSEE